MSLQMFKKYDKVKIINTPGLDGKTGTVTKIDQDKASVDMGNYSISILKSKLTLLPTDVVEPVIKIFKRQPAIKNPKASSTAKNLEEQVEALSLQPEEDKRIYFVLIRAHSGIPLKKTKNPEKVETVTPDPKIMTVYKITSALNGLRNCGNLNYEEKKNTIQTSIKKYYETLNGRSLPDIASVCLKIQTDLRSKEQSLFTETIAKSHGRFDQRNIISNAKFINKDFTAYEKKERPELFTTKTSYKVIDCFYYDMDNSNPFVQNGHFEYNDVVNNSFAGERFNIQDILSKLQQLNIHNVVLLDFGCSTYKNKEKLYNQVELDELTNYLNEQNLHGGIYTKTHKKYKSKSRKNRTHKTSTRKTSKKRKSRKTSKK